MNAELRRMNGAHALVGALELEGIRHLFGVPGHGAYPIYDALNDFPSVVPIVGRNEQGALFAADGYARVTQDVAVATSVPLAGVSNSLTGLWEANGHGSRLIFLLEHDPVHAELLRPVALHHRVVRAIQDIAPEAHDLVRRLRAGRPGVAVLEVPNGVLHEVASVDPRDGFADGWLPRIDQGAVDRAADALSRSERPVVCAGGIAWDGRSSAALTLIAERLKAPVLTLGTSKGALADGHPLCLGFNWSVDGRGENLLASADVVLAIGPRDGMATGSRTRRQLSEQLVHVDWDGSEQGPTFPARLQLNGHIPSILVALQSRVRPRLASAWPTDELHRIRSGARDNALETIPWAVPFFDQLRDALPQDGILFTDSLAGLWAARLFPAPGPNLVHFPWSTGTLGHGIPAAVGAAIALPDRLITVLAGDGAFLYNSQELAAMNAYRRKIVVVVANDNAYGAIRFNMTERFGRSIAHGLTNPDFVKLGEAYGMRSVRLETLDSIGRALRLALKGPESWLIEVPLQLRPPRL